MSDPDASKEKLCLGIIEQYLDGVYNENKAWRDLLTHENHHNREFYVGMVAGISSVKEFVARIMMLPEAE